LLRGRRGPERSVEQMKGWFVGLMVVLGLTGCAEGEVYEVAPDLKRCENFLCTYGKELDTGREESFVGGIDRFEFRWGVLQKVRLRENDRSDPAAIILKYSLVEVIDTERVPEGATFQLSLNREFVSGNRSGGFTLLDRYPMVCDSDALCAALEQKRLAAEDFTLEMRYPRSDGDPLVVTRIP
jgi:hypothetical protein